MAMQSSRRYLEPVNDRSESINHRKCICQTAENQPTKTAQKTFFKKFISDFEKLKVTVYLHPSFFLKKEPERAWRNW
jgi:hypothetical protein